MWGREEWTVFVPSDVIEEVGRLADWLGFINAGRLELAEPVASLQARFRRVEATLAPESRLPDPLPASWLGVERAGRRLSFVESAYREGTGALPVPVPVDGRPVVSPMSLREIFVALANAYRFTDGRAVG